MHTATQLSGPACALENPPTAAVAMTSHPGWVLTELFGINRPLCWGEARSGHTGPKPS